MEQINNKNKRLTVIVASLLVVIGISFAYFVATTLINGNGSTSSIKTAKINGATINVEGTLEFNDLDILPGHKNVSAIKLTATGNNQLVSYNLIWNGTNSLNTPLNYTVYKTTEQINPTASCERKTGVVSGKQVLSEVCNISNQDQLGNIIASGTINKSIETTKVTLIQDEMITATSDGAIVYYYVVLEYPNLDESQDIDMGGTFQGEVTVEASSAQADISIVAIYQEQEDGNYTKVNTIPSSTSNYILNEERSTCTNNATPTWNKEEWSLEVNNLTKSGTDCNLYFAKKPTSEDTIAKLKITNIKTTAPDFSQVATTDEGVFKAEDGMYGGNSYYWRGAVTNNYVKFAGFCWRIIRINGDGTLRLIYDGTTCHANGQNTTENLAVTSQAYNSNYNRSEYVGYTYASESQRPNDNATGTASNLKAQTENWYKKYIAGTATDSVVGLKEKGYDAKVATGNFCNDRNTASGSTWASQPTSDLYYAAYGRLQIVKTPTLNCTNSGDVYNLKVGAITADEVAFAGGVVGTANNVYYLYNGQYYWTLSPYYWWYNSSSSHGALVFFVQNDGRLNNGNGVHWTAPGVRPVINLKSDITISSGNGTLDTPFVVAD